MQGDYNIVSYGRPFLNPSSISSREYDERVRDSIPTIKNAISDLIVQWKQFDELYSQYDRGFPNQDELISMIVLQGQNLQKMYNVFLENTKRRPVTDPKIRAEAFRYAQDLYSYISSQCSRYRMNWGQMCDSYTGQASRIVDLFSPLPPPPQYQMQQQQQQHLQQQNSGFMGNLFRKKTGTLQKGGVLQQQQQQQIVTRTRSGASRPASFISKNKVLLSNGEYLEIVPGTPGVYVNDHEIMYPDNTTMANRLMEVNPTGWASRQYKVSEVDLKNLYAHVYKIKKKEERAQMKRKTSMGAAAAGSKRRITKGKIQTKSNFEEVDKEKIEYAREAFQTRNEVEKLIHEYENKYKEAKKHYKELENIYIRAFNLVEKEEEKKLSEKLEVVNQDLTDIKAYETKIIEKIKLDKKSKENFELIQEKISFNDEQLKKIDEIKDRLKPKLSTQTQKRSRPQAVQIFEPNNIDRPLLGRIRIQPLPSTQTDSEHTRRQNVHFNHNHKQPTLNDRTQRPTQNVRDDDDEEFLSSDYHSSSYFVSDNQNKNFDELTKLKDQFEKIFFCKSDDDIVKNYEKYKNLQPLPTEHDEFLKNHMYDEDELYFMSPEKINEELKNFKKDHHTLTAATLATAGALTALSAPAVLFGLLVVGGLTFSASLITDRLQNKLQNTKNYIKFVCYHSDSEHIQNIINYAASIKNKFGRVDGIYFEIDISVKKHIINIPEMLEFLKNNYSEKRLIKYFIYNKKYVFYYDNSENMSLPTIEMGSYNDLFDSITSHAEDLKTFIKELPHANNLFYAN